MANVITILYVANQEKSKSFYQEVFQSKPFLDVEGMTEFNLFEKFNLGLMPENGISKILKDKTPHPKEGNGIPRCELYFRVDNPKMYIQRAIDNGAKLISEFQNRSWNEKVAYLSDFDGHILAFSEIK